MVAKAVHKEGVTMWIAAMRFRELTEERFYEIVKPR